MRWYVDVVLSEVVDMSEEGQAQRTARTTAGNRKAGRENPLSCDDRRI
jgi:hypothetical protein